MICTVDVSRNKGIADLLFSMLEAVVQSSGEGSEASSDYLEEFLQYFGPLDKVELSRLLRITFGRIALADEEVPKPPAVSEAEIQAFGHRIISAIAAQVLSGEFEIPHADPLAVTSLLLQPNQRLATAIVGVYCLSYLECRAYLFEPVLMYDEYHRVYEGRLNPFASKPSDSSITISP